ncbi:hypothetical protein MRS76_12465 [Rhizobiaceae bacterium n13]|uniref:DUF1579 domain-containing protein n=1 Tax=Ferirhizobium litorale TaxID=2927786 RepID=A0AAE3QJI9_9HYPH|nr:hypothetical protein [Fererhizobium litorale]MDI7862772.1 hypothetical protein [Fererhizobium litorale]MDI7924364.1 hypothetical protein [Fererhizobium litorale]
MKIWHLLCAATLLIAGNASAEEAQFLKSLQGTWIGGGMVKVRANLMPINVSCSFNSQATSADLSMKGTCSGLVLVRRSIGADIRFKGGKYTGSYVGPSGRKAGLAGRRSGNAINLTIRWAREVNGDLNASLMVQKVGSNGMKLVTIDEDPGSGDRIITSEISLRRK